MAKDKYPLNSVERRVDTTVNVKWEGSGMKWIVYLKRPFVQMCTSCYDEVLNAKCQVVSLYLCDFAVVCKCLKPTGEKHKIER